MNARVVSANWQLAFCSCLTAFDVRRAAADVPRTQNTLLPPNSRRSVQLFKHSNSYDMYADLSLDTRIPPSLFSNFPLLVGSMSFLFFVSDGSPYKYASVCAHAYLPTASSPSPLSPCR